ncbi:hypothetical protein GC176_04390 [bacterium]|nr:hypothetical protein [bacterium]
MTCDEFQKQLDDTIDRRLDGDRSPDRLFGPTTGPVAALNAATPNDGGSGSVKTVLEDHAARCSTCRERWGEFQLLERAIVEWRGSPKTSPPSDDFTERVLREIRAAGLRPADSPSTDVGTSQPAASNSSNANARTPKPIRVWEILVTVALVLIAVFVVFRDSGSQLAEHGTEQGPASPFESPQDNELVDLTDLLSDARVALTGLTERASERAGRFRVFVPDVSSSLTLDAGSTSPANSQPSEPSPQNSGDTPTDSESDNISSESLRRALDFLFEAAGPAEQQTT